MVKRTIKETINEYNEAGKVVKQTITETTEDDDTAYVPYFPTITGPYIPPQSTPHDPFLYQPYCTSGARENPS